MQIDILHRPVSSLARVQLAAGESVVTEPGAMVGMSPHLALKTGMGAGGGGFLGKMVKAASRMLTAESFFQNTYTSEGAPGELLLAHQLPGDMVVLPVPQHGLSIQSGAYVASSPGVSLSTQLGGARTFFGGEGLFIIQATPRDAADQVLIGAFGGIQEMACDGSLVIDNGHLVAWESSLRFDLQQSSGGLISTLLSSEGIVCHFQGHGRIWIQTRNPADFGRRIGGLLPPREG